MVGTKVAFEKLALEFEALTADAIPIFVFVEIDISGIAHLLEDFLCAKFMPLFGGTDEVVVPTVEGVPRLSKRRRHFIDELLRR